MLVILNIRVILVFKSTIRSKNVLVIMFVRHHIMFNYATHIRSNGDGLINNYCIQWKKYIS